MILAAAVLLALQALAAVAICALRDASLLVPVGPLALAALLGARGIWLRRPWARGYVLVLAALTVFLSPWCAIGPLVVAAMATPWDRHAVWGLLGGAARAAAATAAVVAVVACFVARPAGEGLASPGHYAIDEPRHFDLADCGGAVRRVIGRPGERIFIHGGDVFVAGQGRLRKPHRVQERLWRATDPEDPLSGPEAFARYWKSSNGHHRIENHRLVTVEKDGARESRFEYARPVVGAGAPVDDVRLAMDVTLYGTAGAFLLEVAQRGGTFTARLTLDRKSTLEFKSAREDVKDLQIPLTDVALERGQKHAVEFWVYDGRALVVVDGRPSAALEIDAGPGPDAPLRIAFEATGFLLGVDRLAVSRDVHFRSSADSPARTLDVPPGHYAVIEDDPPLTSEPALVDRRRIEGKVFLRFAEDRPRLRLAR